MGMDATVSPSILTEEYIMNTKITTHHDGLGLNDLIEIIAEDHDVNGVPHKFFFEREFPGEEGADTVGFIQFQKGPRNLSDSTPGITTDAVLVVLIEMLKGFQNGPYSSPETAEMLVKLEECLAISKKRAQDRAARGVLGHNAK